MKGRAATSFIRLRGASYRALTTERGLLIDTPPGFELMCAGIVFAFVAPRLSTCGAFLQDKKKPYPFG
jgi:hypothetical protein